MQKHIKYYYKSSALAEQYTLKGSSRRPFLQYKYTILSARIIISCEKKLIYKNNYVVRTTAKCSYEATCSIEKKVDKQNVALKYGLLLSHINTWLVLHIVEYSFQYLAFNKNATKWFEGSMPRTIYARGINSFANNLPMCIVYWKNAL